MIPEYKTKHFCNTFLDAITYNSTLVLLQKVKKNHNVLVKKKTNKIKSSNGNEAYTYTKKLNTHNFEKEFPFKP